MKKIIYEISAVLALAAALFISASCEEEKPSGELLTPDFPELVTEYDVAPGTELTLSIVPNMDWTISIPVESYKWFKILDGRFEVQTLSGPASKEPVTITIATSTEESFSIRSTDVIMKMGNSEQVIAKYTLMANERTIQVYAASMNEDGNFIFQENHQHVYDSEEMTQLDLRWDENDDMFYYPIKVISNYEWTVQWPSWARADITEDTRTGEICFDVYGISSRLPMDGAQGEINFLSGDQVVKTFPISIPACKDKFQYNLSGNTQLMYDHAGYMHTDQGVYTKEPVPGFIFGPEESRLVVMEKDASGNYVQSESPWLIIEIDPWDSIEGADVLQTRQFTLSAPKYMESEDREAIILFLPATAPEDLSEIISSSGVAEAYKQYAVPVSQTGRPAEYFTFEASADEMELAGVEFNKSQSELLPEKNFEFAEGCQTYQYNLSYVKEMASSRSALFVSEPFEEILIYDAEGNAILDSDRANHWLSFNQMGEGLKGQVVMDVTKITESDWDEVEGYLVFVDDDGKVLCVVHCLYQKEVEAIEDTLVDVGSEFFVDSAAAARAGATMHEVTAGPTYESHKESLAPIYILKFTKNNTELDIRTSTELFMYMCQGKSSSGPEMVTVDNQDYAETMGFMLEWNDRIEAYVGPYSGTTTIKMTMPADAESTSMTEVIQFNSSMESNSRVMNIICVLDLSGTEN